MFTAVPIFITIIGLIVVGAVVIGLAKSAAEWSYNNGQPVRTVDATIVAKRTHVRSSASMHNHGHDHHLSQNDTRTDYFVTFEFGSGERREVRVKGDEYGLLVEGDHGAFTHQGTRYLGFARVAS